jgi:hypothetical protein
MNKEAVLNFGLSVLLGLTIFSAGFYFGYRNNRTDQKQEIASQNVAGVIESQGLESSENSQNFESKKIEGVFWIKAGEKPVCPDIFPIKGKFDSPVNIFYSKENKFYDRVVPHICFVNVEFARDEAGFLQKF